MPHEKDTPENEDLTSQLWALPSKTTGLLPKEKTHPVASLEMPLYTMLKRITTGKRHYHSLTNTAV